MVMATKPNKVATFNEKLPSIKSEDPLTMWPGKVTKQIKSVISL